MDLRRWTGAGKTFEHAFGEDGTVRWIETSGRREEAGTRAPTKGKRKNDQEPAHTKAHYEVAPVNDEVYAVSYLSGSGYTLTSVLDFASGTVVSFASNEKELVVQRGTFEVAEWVG